jgi:hypothetical protein
MTKPDHFRAALVGLAPLVLGAIVVLLIALDVLALDVVFEPFIAGDFRVAMDHLKAVLTLPDVLLWMYLLVTISNMMLPSASDRASWIPVGIFLVLLLIPVILLRPDIVQLPWVNGLVDGAIKSLATAFGITASIDFLLVLPLLVIHRVLGVQRG